MTTSEYMQASQARTLEGATRNGTHWTQAELDTVRRLEGEGLTHEQVAVTVHRTLYAIQSVGKQLVERAERVPSAASSATTRAFDQGFTDLAAWEASFTG